MMLTSDSTLEEVAATVSGALEEAGIRATLSGGGAVSIYSDNQYQSKDLDFVTAFGIDDIKPVMEALGFESSASGLLSTFEHPEIDWFVEFVSAPISFGNMYVREDDCAVLEFPKGSLRIITPTQSVMDRLAWAMHHNDPQARDQAAQIVRHQEIDWSEIKTWFSNEGLAEQDFEEFRAFAAAA